MNGWLDTLAGDLFLGQNEITRSNASDAQLAQINDAALARGAVTQAEHDQTAANIQNQNIDNILSNPETSIASGFTTGAMEGLRNDVTLVEKGIGSVASSVGWKGYAVLGVGVLLFLAYSGALPSRRR